MQVRGLRPVPILVRDQGDRACGPDAAVVDDFVAGLAVGYTAEPPGRRHLLTWRDLDGLGWSHPALRGYAMETLHHRLGAMRVCGAPPALMLSFDGLESSLLLADAVWSDLARVVPGDLVVGVPTPDAVIVTSSRSRIGLERLRRAVDRMFYARPRYPLSPQLLVRTGRAWEPLPDHSVRWAS